eukprot:scpid73397/ scgid30983/ 
MESEKAARCPTSEMSEQPDDVLVRRPLDRAEALFFGGYVHNVAVCWSTPTDTECYVRTKCWATQKKSTRYDQKLIGKEHDEQMTYVGYGRRLWRTVFTCARWTPSPSDLQ